MANIRSLSDLKSGGGGGGGGMPPGMGGRGGGGGGGGHGGHGHPPPGGGRGIDHKNVKIIRNPGQYERELSQAGSKLVVVDFTASWCGPCQFIAPHVAELSVKYPNVVFLQVDVDDLDEIAHSANVSAMPTFHFIRHSKKIDEMVGADPGKLESLVQKHKDGGGSAGGASAAGSGGHRLGSATDQPPAQPAPAADPAAARTAAAAAAARATTAPAAASGGRKPADPAAVAQLMDMGFNSEQCERALTETGNSVPNALDWLLTHGSESSSGGNVLGSKPAAVPAPAPAAAAASTPAASAAPSATPTPMDVTPTHAASATPAATPAAAPVAATTTAEADAEFAAALQAEENARVAEPGQEKKPLTPEQLAEQKLKVQKKLDEIRRKKAEDEEKYNREREMNRRKSGKEMEEARRKHEEEMARKAAEKIRREQEEDRKYKEKLLEKLKQDKLNREAAKKHEPVAEPTTAAAAAVAPTPAATKKEYTECVIQIRTADGKALQHTFKPTDKLRAVYDFCLQNGVHAPFTLQSNFPKKTYSGAALDNTTLQQADMVPRGALMIGK